MREKIQQIYNQKAGAYLDVLDDFDKFNIDYILLNLLVPDDNPGDLDILIFGSNISRTNIILEAHDFVFYANYEKGQVLWNKYIKGTGFVQIHVYDSLFICGREYFDKCLIEKQLSNKIEFHFYIFLVETLFKAKLRSTQYLEYKSRCSLSNLLVFINSVSPQNIIIAKYVIECYESTHIIDHHKRNYLLWRNRPFERTKALLVKCGRRIRAFLRNDNIYVLFLGVDGAGKTTLTEEVYKVFAKGGIFPKRYYLGLRDSYFTPKRSGNYQKFQDKTKYEGTNYHLPLTPLRFCKIILYWLEYNLKYLKKVGLHPYGVRTLFLIDRSYLDLLRFYPYTVVKTLLIKFSFIPHKIVFLSGDEETLYNRKKEMTRKEYHERFIFYSELVGQLQTYYKKNVIYVDTTKEQIENIIFSISDYIME